MTRLASRVQSHRKSWWKLKCVRPDGLTWVAPEKAIRPALTRLFCKNLKEKKGKNTIASFDELWYFCSDSKKQSKNFLIVEYFLLFSRVRPCIAFYYGWTKFSKFSTLSGHVIKCLLTNFCLAEIFGSRSWRTDLGALSPYIMTSSQIFFPCLPFE